MTMKIAAYIMILIQANEAIDVFMSFTNNCLLMINIAINQLIGHIRKFDFT